jgi:predicted ATP-dependent serine protease
METTTDPEETFDCESCGEPTDRTIGLQVAPGEWETFVECEACAEEAREWNDSVLEQETLSDAELEQIIREEEDQVRADMAWAEENEVF